VRHTSRARRWAGATIAIGAAAGPAGASWQAWSSDQVASIAAGSGQQIAPQLIAAQLDQDVALTLRLDAWWRRNPPFIDLHE
jgi:hypothetical protein